MIVHSLLSRVIHPVETVAEWGAERSMRLALRDALGVRVRDVVNIRSPHGRFYRVDTDAGVVGVRLPLYPDVCRRAVETARLLEWAGVRHQRLIHVDGSDETSPHGLIVQEWVAGISGTAAIHAGIVREHELFLEVGRALNRVQREAVGAFGPRFWQHPPEAPARFSDLPFVRSPSRRLTRLGASSKLDMRLIASALGLAASLHAEVRYDDAPVLVHGDLRADNVIVADEGVTIIDWLNAHGGCRIADFVRTRSLQGAQAVEAMKEGFGIHPTTPSEDTVLERYLSLHFQVGLIEHHARHGEWAGCDAVQTALRRDMAAWSAQVVV